VEILTDSKDVKQYIKKMLLRDNVLKGNWGTICTLVEMEAAEGKKVVSTDNYLPEAKKNKELKKGKGKK
jgi:hypothetical protein